ncbi:DUF6371 domain-containing protein [Roseibium sp. RKSG952]|uniref:DUF6371 domain-containing protein n=1 Tax=Roseibium sp. RKSG952 TaxID=2529384 RepID=UPI0012BD08F6|nr:DUF6371 domain-containing protein [Roseibium sp. RKSG952]MTH96126.1 ATP-binding protein [Roseibium sp. RKSG952]
MHDDPFARLDDDAYRMAQTDPKRRCVVPVPVSAPAPPARHPSLGAPSKVWTYRDQGACILGFVFRFDRPNEGKSFRPLALFEEPGALCWRWQIWPEARPLYGLDRLAANPQATVVICEGEKAADAAQILLPGYVCMTSPGGSNAAQKADWSPLISRKVILWPDADPAGTKFAETAAKLIIDAGAKAVSCLQAPTSSPAGWDAADALESGWTETQAQDFLISAIPVQSEQPGRKAKTRTRKTAPKGKQKKPAPILSAAEEAELWHSPEKQAYASVKINGHFEHRRIDSAAFKRWLAAKAYHQTGTVPSSQTISDALRILEVRAITEGPQHPAMLRSGWDGETVWLDLCDDHWRAVRINRHGWDVMEHPPVKFIRSETMAALPDPEKGGMIEEFRSFVNSGDDDFKLIVTWLVASLFGRNKTFPVLALGGEQGSGKSTMARLLRSLTDPSHVAALATPKDERDFFVMAMSGHVMSFDNVSKVEAWFSDAICRLSTGAGFVTRKLHSDADPFWFQGARPVLLNGIPSLTERADLAERSLTVRLLRIDETSRQSEDEFWTVWEAVRPGVLGALLDAVSSALRHWDETNLTHKPRMADFAHMMAAAEPGLGWETGAFMDAYTANRQATTEAVFESDPVAVAILKFIREEHPTNGWEGTATELLAHLDRIVSEDFRRSQFWPKKANALGNAVDRAAPLLRHKGIQVMKRSTGVKRLIKIHL